MSKYSGFILSVMLVLICLWINICRYPSVWRMLQGQYEPQAQAGKLDVPAKNLPVPGKESVDHADMKTSPAPEQAPKRDAKSPKNKESRGPVVLDDTSNPYQTVSYGSQLNSEGQARGPVPVVPRPQIVKSSNSDTNVKSEVSGNKEAGAGYMGKEEKKNRTRQDEGDDPEDNTLSDRVFRAPTLTRPVSDRRAGESPRTPSQDNSVKKNSASGDDTGAVDSGNSESDGSDESDGYVSVIVPAEQAQLVTQRSGIRLTSGSSSPTYGPVGGKGTLPMSLDHPTYAPK